MNGASAISADVVHRKDVRVVQRRGRAGFLLESMEAIDVGRECAGQDLDRNVAPEPRIARAIDLAHAAGTECGHDRDGPRRAPGCRGME